MVLRLEKLFSQAETAVMMTESESLFLRMPFLSPLPLLFPLPTAGYS
jgi:hypothetical protein